MKAKKSGFTLIELSITLVIIGLLTSGVLLGQDLIRAAEIRRVISDAETYKTAYNTFKLKYNCIAGDCANATDYFGEVDSNPLTCQATASVGTLTCNGDGDGRVSVYSVSPTYYERFRFWQQLSAAKLIRGHYTGVTGSGGPTQCIIGTNCPEASLPSSGFTFGNWGYFAGSTSHYAMNYGNVFVFGKAVGALTGEPIFTPAEAFAFDQKIDDGKPATGLAIARNNALFGDVNACTTSINANDYTGEYNTTSSVVSCSFNIKTGDY